MKNRYRWHPNEHKDKYEDAIRQMVRTLDRFGIVSLHLRDGYSHRLKDAVLMFHDLIEYWDYHATKKR